MKAIMINKMLGMNNKESILSFRIAKLKDSFFQVAKRGGWRDLAFAYNKKKILEILLNTTWLVTTLLVFKINDHAFTFASIFID